MNKFRIRILAVTSNAVPPAMHEFVRETNASYQQVAVEYAESWESMIKENNPVWLIDGQVAIRTADVRAIIVEQAEEQPKLALATVSQADLGW